jgi:hypothetical protein
MYNDILHFPCNGHAHSCFYILGHVFYYSVLMWISERLLSDTEHKFHTLSSIIFQASAGILHNPHQFYWLNELFLDAHLIHLISRLVSHWITIFLYFLVFLYTFVLQSYKTIDVYLCTLLSLPASPFQKRMETTTSCSFIVPFFLPTFIAPLNQSYFKLSWEDERLIYQWYSMQNNCNASAMLFCSLKTVTAIKYRTFICKEK